MSRSTLKELSSLFILLLSLTALDAQRTRKVRSIGKFHSFAHDINSDEVTILDEKTIRITNFTYDGTGPAAWFVLGTGSDYRKERVQLKGVTPIPDENESCRRLKHYKDKTFELVLPDALTFNGFDYLAAYCFEFRHNFGYIRIPKRLNVPNADSTSLHVCKTKWNTNMKTTESTTRSSGFSRRQPRNQTTLPTLKQLAARLLSLLNSQSSNQ